MAFTDALNTIRHLKKRKIIRDYVLIGAVAAMFYLEPSQTEDIDVILLANTDDEFFQTFRQITEVAEGMSGMHHILNGVPVQMFPSTTKPLYLDTLRTARLIRLGNIRVKVPTPEHLVLLFLEAFRQKDKLRIVELLPMTNDDTLQSLVERFDDEENTLAGRLQELH